MIKSDFLQGIKDGVPIFLGYVAVSFSFGIIAVSSGLSVFEAVLISLTNLTSAGQFAGVGIIASGAGFVEMALTQLVINMRYFFMSSALSQKYGRETGMAARMGAAFFVTDEIFAVAAGRDARLTGSYMGGIGMISAIGWTAGTLIGAAAGDIFPAWITDSLSIALYAMFIAIVMPAAKKQKAVLLVVCLAVILSCCLTFIPVFKGLSYGFRIIIAALTSSVAGAILFPVQEEAENE